MYLKWISILFLVLVPKVSTYAPYTSGGGTSHSELSFFQGHDLYSDIYFPPIFLQPKSTRSLPHRHRQSRNRHRKTALSMYSSPQFIHRTECYDYRPRMSPVPSLSTLDNYPNASSLCDAYAGNSRFSNSHSNACGFANSVVLFDGRTNGLGKVCPGVFFDETNYCNGLLDGGEGGISWGNVYSDDVERKFSDPVYYECDGFEMTGDLGKGWAKTDLRVLPILEEVYGEV